MGCVSAVCMFCDFVVYASSVETSYVTWCDMDVVSVAVVVTVTDLGHVLVYVPWGMSVSGVGCVDEVAVVPECVSLASG